MTDQLEIDRLFQELHAARVGGDLATMLNTFCDDASFRIIGASDGKPIAINAVGVAEFRPWLAMMVKAFRLSDYVLQSLLIDGARAAAHWRVTIYSRITGTVVPTELVDLIEVREGRIGVYTEFFTTG